MTVEEGGSELCSDRMSRHSTPRPTPPLADYGICRSVFTSVVQSVNYITAENLRTSQMRRHRTL